MKHPASFKRKDIDMIPNQRKKEKLKNIICAITSITAFILLWQIAVTVGWIDDRACAAPSEVLSTFIDKWTNTKPDGSTLGTHLLVSLKLASLGFLVAVVIGVPMGLLMGYFKGMDAFLTPIFEIVRPIPPLAWIPVVLLTLGIGTEAKAFIIFIASFVPCVINSYTGIKRANPVLLNVAKTAGASRWQIFFKVGIPSATPMMFTGIKISLGSAWATLVAAEMLSSSQGLGYLIQRARNLVRSDLIIVGMLVIGVIGALFTLILEAVETKVAPWRKK
jgi:NitT/TauT family transport system permease protein